MDSNNKEMSSHNLGDKFPNPGFDGNKIVEQKFNSIGKGNDSAVKTSIKLKGG